MLKKKTGGLFIVKWYVLSGLEMELVESANQFKLFELQEMYVAVWQYVVV
jgi:hypothetical protein